MGLLEGFEMTGIILGFIITLIVGFWMFFKRYHYWIDKPIPFDSSMATFRSTLSVFMGNKKLVDFDKELYARNGRLFGSYAGIYPVIFIAEPELLKAIFNKDFATFSTRRIFKTGDPIVDNMVSSVKGDDQWRNLRNTITPAFATGRLKKMLPLIRDCAKTCVENFEKFSQNGEPVNCKTMYGGYTLDVIANVAFGTQIDSIKDPDNVFVKHAKKVFSSEINWKMILMLVMPRFARKLGIGFFPHDALQFFKELILEIVKIREAKKEVRNDFLQIMMDSLKEVADDDENSVDAPKSSIKNVENIKRKPLTKDEFLAQTIVFFIAGYDTTANALTTVSYYLATNPECQKKALQEVDQIWKDRETIDDEAIFEAKYIGAAIDEALRLSPAFIRHDRTCAKDFKLGDTGVTIPAGMLVQIPVYSMHHDPEFFPDPEKFDPERFLGESKAIITSSSTYLPFGSGPRNCVAMRLALLEVKLCLLYILRQFEFSPSAKTKIPMEYKNTLLLQPQDIILRVIRRK